MKMKTLKIEAFRVKVVNGLKTASLEAISLASGRSRSIVERLLLPLRLGDRLEFGFAEADDAGWLVVRVAGASQTELFEALPQDASGLREAHAAAKLFKEYVTRLRTLVREARISGAMLESYANEFGELAAASKAFGVKNGDETSVSVRSKLVPATDTFHLSGIPQRCVGPDLQIEFRVEMLGINRAEVRVLGGVHEVLRCSRVTMRMRFAEAANNPVAWRILERGMLARRVMRCQVRGVVNTQSGRVTELLLKSVPSM
jgi:hypothetical protein